MAVAIRRDIFNQAVVEARTDLIDHPYIMAVDNWELGWAKEKKRRTRAPNAGGIETSSGLARHTTMQEERGRGSTLPRRTFEKHETTTIGLFEGLNEHIGNSF